jgi:presqualene diphosphate synthase
MSDGAAPIVPVATGSSFYLAMRILPEDRRKAMYAVYRFCRAVDDVADGGGSPARRLADLERWRADIGALFARRAPAELGDIAEAVRRFGLRQADFDTVIDGMAMDAAGDIRAPDWATLDLYCDRVASAVGRMSVRIFGMPADAGEALAHHLGRALQLTNILRDIDEDAAVGRLYLPREALNAAGIASDEPLAVAADERLPAACADVVARAGMHFETSRSIMAGQPRSVVRAPRLMAAAYGSVLDRLVARGFAPPRRRVRASKLRVLVSLLRYGVP